MGSSRIWTSNCIMWFWRTGPYLGGARKSDFFHFISLSFIYFLKFTKKEGKFQKYEICKFQNQPVVDIKFSPRHLGLKLATGWVDGIVRIYEAMDIMNLSQWSLMVRYRFYFSLSKLSIYSCHFEYPTGRIRFWKY